MTPAEWANKQSKHYKKGCGFANFTIIHSAIMASKVIVISSDEETQQQEQPRRKVVRAKRTKGSSSKNPIVISDDEEGSPELFAKVMASSTPAAEGSTSFQEQGLKKAAHITPAEQEAVDALLAMSKQDLATSWEDGEKSGEKKPVVQKMKTPPPIILGGKRKVPADYKSPVRAPIPGFDIDHKISDRLVAVVKMTRKMSPYVQLRYYKKGGMHRTVPLWFHEMYSWYKGLKEFWALWQKVEGMGRAGDAEFEVDSLKLQIHREGHRNQLYVTDKESPRTFFMFRDEVQKWVEDVLPKKVFPVMYHADYALDFGEWPANHVRKMLKFDEEGSVVAEEKDSSHLLKMDASTDTSAVDVTIETAPSVVDTVAADTSEIRKQLDCLGCEKDWPSQKDHACCMDV